MNGALKGRGETRNQYPFLSSPGLGEVFGGGGTPDRSRTCDLCLRRAALYPAELLVLGKGKASISGPRIMFNESVLKQKVGEILAIQAEFRICNLPWPETALSEGERVRLQSFTHFGRRLDWLRGRAALKGLLGKWGQSEDTAELQFPNSRLSVSHSGGLAIAGGILSGSGFGLDYEAGRQMRPETARFFLSAEEQRNAALNSPNQLLRLWTVKEALFKADLSNAGKGLRNYRVMNLSAMSGKAFGSENTGTGTEFVYASWKWETGFLTVAVPASFSQAFA